MKYFTKRKFFGIFRLGGICVFETGISHGPDIVSLMGSIFLLVADYSAITTV